MSNGRGFYWSNKSWYANSKSDHEIMFGIYETFDGLYGEMAMHWVNLGNKMAPRIECFDDAWKVLNSFADVIQELAKHDNENITEEDFVELLLSLGFEDLTQYVRKGYDD